MALVLADRVRDTTTTTGTGTVTLSGTAPTGYQTFGAAIGNTNTTYYTINAGSQWEVGLGTYSSTGPTLARTTVLASSNGGSLVDFSTGTKDVFVTYPAEEAVYQDGSAIKAGTAILGVTNGGTGTNTTFTAGSVVFAGASGVYTQDNANLFWDNSNDRLGIGTSSPVGKIDYISGSARVYMSDQGSAGFITAVNTTNTAYAPLALNGSVLILKTGDAERARIDASGNVGIGTSSPGVKLDVAGDIRSTSGNYYAANGGVYGWGSLATYVGGSSATNIITFQTNSSERMRIDSSGNVGIGTTAPQSKMEIRATSGGSTFNALTLSNYVGASVNTGVALYFDPNGAGSLARAASIQSVQATSGNYADMRFFTANSDTPAERMKITPGGVVAIGGGTINSALGDMVLSKQSAGTATFALESQGSWNSTIASSAAGNMIFSNPAATERMRLNTSGTILVNTTSTPTYGSPKLIVDGPISGKGTVAINSSTATTIAEGAGFLIVVRNNTHGGTAVVQYENAQTPIIIATSGGTTFQTTTPSGSAQIQLTNRSGNLGIAALASGDRDGASLSVTILQAFT